MRQKVHTVLRNGTKTLIAVPDHTPVVALQTGNRRPFFMVDCYYFFIDVVKLMDRDQPVLRLVVEDDWGGGGEMVIAGPGDTQSTDNTDAYSIPYEAATHVKTILAHQLRGPYMLGGSSASGIVAYETAQQLRALGHEVGLLVLFDTPNWSTPEDAHIWQSLAFYREDLKKLHWTQYPGWAIGKVRGLFDRKVPGQLSARAQAAGKYLPAPYDGRFLLVKRMRCTGRDLNPSFGWSTVVPKVDVCKVSALEHKQILEVESDRVAVAQALNKAIAEVNEQSSSREYSSSHQKEEVVGVPVRDALIRSEPAVTVGTPRCKPQVV